MEICGKFLIHLKFGAVVSNLVSIDYLYLRSRSIATEFDVVPPVSVPGSSLTEPSDFLGSGENKRMFADETTICRWRVPEDPVNSIFAQISVRNMQKRNFVYSGTDENRGDTDHVEDQYLEVSNKSDVDEVVRRQQDAWLQKAAQEALNKKKRIKRSDGSRDVVVLADGKVQQTAIKMVEVLSYTASFFRLLNNGDFEAFAELMWRYVAPSCSINIFTSSNPIPIKVIPRDKLVDYFKELVDAIPDALWRVEDTKLSKGTPRTVISKFSRSGISLILCI